MNRFFNRFVTLNHAVLRAGEPGDDGASLPLDPFAALDRADESFHAELAKMAVEDEERRRAAAPPPPAGTEHPQESAPVEQSLPPAAGAPSPQPPSYDVWEEQRRVANAQTQTLQAIADRLAQMPTPQPAAPAAPVDPFADYRAPERRPGMHDDAYALEVVRSMSRHAAEHSATSMREQVRQELTRELAPVIDYVRRSQMQQAWATYNSQLDEAVAKAGYAPGTNQHHLVKQAVNGLAMQAANAQVGVDQQWLVDAANVYNKYLPPQRGPQGVVASEPGVANAPVSGNAPAGSAMPGAPPSAQTQPSKNLDDAHSNFQADMQRLFARNRAG